MGLFRCTYCGSRLHTLRNCPKTWIGQANRVGMRCSYCGSNNHNLNACPSTFFGNAARACREDKIKDDFIKD